MVSGGVMYETSAGVGGIRPETGQRGFISRCCGDVHLPATVRLHPLPGSLEGVNILHLYVCLLFIEIAPGGG